MSDEVQSWKACRVHFAVGKVQRPHLDVSYDSFEDIDIVEGALVFSNEQGNWLYVVAAGSWSHFEYV